MGCSRRELSPTIDALTLINPVAVTETIQIKTRVRKNADDIKCACLS
jgi:hypothetical protein